MGLKGSFEEFSVTDIVQVIHLQGKSGRLTVESGVRQWLFGFENGMLVQAHCQEPGRPRLGEILVRQGFIDRETLSAALREQETHPRHLGLVLEEMGMVTHQDVTHALTFQIQETALNLFFHPRGNYRFERIPVDYDREYVTPINTEYLLMEGARRVDEWPAIRRVVGGGDAVFTPSEAASGTLSTVEETVIQALDGERDVTAVVTTTGLGLFETCRTVADLSGRGLVAVATAGESPLFDPVSGVGPGGEEGSMDGAGMGMTASGRHAGGPWVWLGAGAALVAASAAVWLGTRATPPF